MSLFDLFGEPVWQRLTWTLLHFVWQGVIIAIAAALLLQISPSRRAHTRYLICLAAFVLMAACPVATFMVSQPDESTVADLQEEGISVSSDADVEGEPIEVERAMVFGHPETPENYPPAESPLSPADVTESPSLAAIAGRSAPALPEPPEPESKIDRLARAINAIQPYVLATWIVGVMAMAFRLSLSWLHIRWLAWGCQLTPVELTGRATLLAERIGIRRTPRIRISEKISEAVVVGLWRPLILLPVSWLTEMSPDVLEAVIAHELAHVRRFDLWVNLLQRLIETLLFYHPAVWWLSRRLSVEREMCADELAVIATNERIVYAEALEQVGRLRLARTAPQLGVGIRDKKMVLLRRVGNVLGLTSSDKRPRSWPVALLALAVPLAVWLASTSVHSSTENQTLAAELNKAELDRWVEKADSPVQSEFDAAVDGLVAMGPKVAREMIPLLKTGRTDRLGLKVLERLAPEPSVQQILIDAIEEAQLNRNPNVIHCGLIALGKSGNVAHADLIAAFLEKRDIAAMSALATLGGERARDHLIGAFDLVPTERWFLLAGTLARLGDSAAVPELKRRLRQVELPPNDRFPPATVAAMTGAISALSGEKETLTTTEYCQGQHFRYPFDGPGWPKTFSVNPLRDHYVRLPKVDPESKAGREAIWNTMAEATKNPGFTIDGNEIVTFHGLKTAPLWPDGRPYPITLYDWLGRTSHQVLLDLVEQQEQTGRCAIPENGLLVALDPASRLYVLSLKKTSDQSTYNVTVMPQDPNMQLIPVRADAEARQLTEATSCTLHDLESETKDGSLNLSRGHLVTMTREKWQAKSPDAVLVAEFASNSTALAIPGAERFVLAKADDAWEQPEKLLSLLQAAAKQEPTIAGHKLLKQGKAIFHVFSQLSEGQKFAFAVNMPDSIPVAGVLEVRKVDRKNETIRLHHRSLLTAAARQVFVTDGRPVAPMAQDELPSSDANPLGLDDDTLITVFRAGNVLRDVAFDCESFYRDRGHLPKDIPELASRYQERGRDSIGNDPFAPGKRLRLILDKDDSRRVQVWSVGPDGDWDDGKQIDSTNQPLDGDLGVEIRVGNTDWHWLADETMRVCLQGERLAHYLAAKGPKLPRPETEDDGLEWGPVVDGLQLAVELSPKKNAYLLGETIDVKFHVRNAVDYAIQVGLAMPWRQDLTDQTVLIHDENGKSLTGKGVWMSGTVGTKQYTLKPGETASYESCDLAFVDPGKEPGGGSVGYWVEAAPGVYTAQFKQHFPIGFHSEPRQWRGELDTASITIRIAEHPKFAIHRVTAYRKPGDQPGMRSTLTFRESGNLARFDPMRPDLYPLEDLVIDGTPLLTEADIVAYNWKDHSIKLKPGVGGRLYNAVKLGNMYVPFVIQVEGEPIYLGAFRPPFTSTTSDLPNISLMELNPSLPESERLARGSITIENGQIVLEGQTIRDPRSDDRSRAALQKAGKLIDVRSIEPAWGEKVDGIACAVRPVKASFAPDEDIAVDVMYKNVSEKSVTVCVCPDHLYTWVHLWVKTAEGQNVLGGAHATGTRLPLKRSDFVTLEPQQTTSFRQVIARSQHPGYWPEPGQYFFHAEINKINRIDQHLPGYGEFCKKHGLTPWVAGIESGPATVVIATEQPPAAQPAYDEPTTSGSNLSARMKELLADADAKFRAGLVKLAEKYPYLKKESAWGTVSTKSAPGSIDVSIFHTNSWKAAQPTPVPKGEEFSIVLVFEEPRSEPMQNAWPSYRNLGLVVQINTWADNSNLDAELKQLVDDALKPLADLDATVSRDATTEDNPDATTAEARTRQLKSKERAFVLRLAYHGPKDNPGQSGVEDPFRSLIIHTTLVDYDLPHTWRAVWITEQQASKIIDHLRKEGFLASARQLTGDSPPQVEGPAYSLTVEAPDNLVLHEVLGWDLKMLERLDAMASVLEGDAAKEMKKVISRLESQRKEWKGNRSGGATDASTLQDVRTLADLRQCRKLKVDDTPWRVRFGLADGGPEAGPWKLVYCLADYTAEGSATLSHKGQTYGEMLGPVFLDVLGDDDAELGPLHGMAAMQSTLPGRQCLFAAVVPMAWEGTYRLRIRSPAGHHLAERRLQVTDPTPCYWSEFAIMQDRDAARSGTVSKVVAPGLFQEQFARLRQVDNADVRNWHRLCIEDRGGVL
jgi:beta-lactamase regulating signal transducer with metallopeptidase domain